MSRRRLLEMLLLRSSGPLRLVAGGKVTRVSPPVALVVFLVVAGCGAIPTTSVPPSSAVTCTNAPGGVLGNCVDVAVCAVLVAELHGARPLPEGTLDMLRLAHCGFHHKQPKVCCPLPSGSSLSGPNATVIPRVGETANETVLQLGSSSNATVHAPAPSLPSPPLEHPNLELLPVEFCGYSVSNKIYQPPNVLSLSDVRPDVARLEYTTWGGRRILCGGSLISERYVLTAAHCVTSLPAYTSLTAVVLGEFDLRHDPDCETVADMEWCAPALKRVLVQRAIPHPKYSAATRRHDIALIRLGEEVQIKEVDDYNAVCLPLSMFHYPLPGGSDLMETAGWGTTLNGSTVTKLRKYGLFEAVDVDQCRTLYRNSTPFVDSVICAKGKTDVDPIFGDTGGPIMVFAQGEGEGAEFLTGPRMLQVGVETFTPPASSRRRLPSLYTKITPYLTWILDNLKP